MSYNKPIASTTEFGVVKVGSGINVSNGIISTNGSGGGGDVGYFFSADTQTNLASINTVRLSNTTLSQGVTLVAGSRLIVSKAGNYTLALMVQYAKSTSSGPAAIAFFWLRKNGVDVADSATDLITTAAGAGTIGSWTYTLPLVANDYLEIVWSSTATNAILIAIPQQVGPPTIPLAPSVRITVLQV